MRFSKIGFQSAEVPAANLAEATDSPHPALELWRRMRSCIARIDGEITTRMRERFDISMPQFEVLQQLCRFPDGLRMGELAHLLQVSGASVTAFIDQLEKTELVLRIPDRVDRRVNSVRLTNAGREMLAKALLEHEQWVVELMEDSDLPTGPARRAEAAGEPAEQSARINAGTAARNKNHALV